MALSKDQPRGKTGCGLPIPQYTVLAAAIRWYSGELCGQDPATGICFPLIPGLNPIGVTESSIDYTTLNNGDNSIEVRSGRAFVLPQDGTIAVDTAIGTPIYWNPTTNKCSLADGGGAYAYCGPLVVCRDLVTVEVSFEPQHVQSANGVMMLAKTITHTDLVDVATSQTIALGVAPGRFVGGSKKLTTPFTGGGAAIVVLDIGGTDADGLVDADNVFSGTAGSEDFAPAGILVAAGYMPDMVGQTINAIFTGDVNVSLLTAGSVTIRLYFAKVP